MKQVNSFSARRHFFRNNRRAMRPLRPGMTPDGLEDSPEMANHNNGFGYFSGKLFFFRFFFEDWEYSFLNYLCDVCRWWLGVVDMSNV